MNRAAVAGAAGWRILLVEDDEDDWVLTRCMLEASSQRVQVEWVTGLEPALERLSEDPPFDAVLADYRLGAHSGIDLVREAARRGVKAPVILLTGQGSREVDVAAMEAGAAEYLTKGELTPQLLERTVRYAIEAKRRDAALRERDEQLRQAQKMEAVGRLAGGIAHDFNNLLTAITGYGELLLMRLPEGDPGRADCEEVLRAAGRAAELTGRLLAFSRGQAMKPRPVNVNRTVGETQRLLRRLIGPNVELVTDLAEQMPRAMVDPGQLEQVLVNLAVNARDAMPRGGRLAVSTAVRDIGAPSAVNDPPLPAGSYVEIAVEDNGTGMAPEVASRIFEPFYTTKGAGEGTGLGLATVYGIVEQSGGTILVRSSEGSGSRFTVLLPAVEGTKKISGETQTVAGPAPQGSATVLVVEDQAEVRRLVETVLTRQGYRVLTAVDAESAATCFDTVRADLLLTDVTLPGRSGRELAADLCARDPQLRVLFMSGHPGNVGAAATNHEPARVFLAKPFVANELLHRVRAALDH